MWSREEKNVLIEVKYNLSFNTDLKFIEVWHKEFFGMLIVYPQSMK